MLILASASPRRQELLRNANIPFIAKAANVVEEHLADESPQEYVLRLAAEKAKAVLSVVPKESGAILAADTEVVLDIQKGLPLGKPRDVEDAARMLRALRNRSHYVITGGCVMWRMGQQGASPLNSETTIVTVRRVP